MLIKNRAGPEKESSVQEAYLSLPRYFWSESLAPEGTMTVSNRFQWGSE